MSDDLISCKGIDYSFKITMTNKKYLHFFTYRPKFMALLYAL